MTAECLHILLVDDNEDDVLLCRKAFKKTRRLVVVHVAEDGEQAMDYLNAENENPVPDLLIVDINMPRMNGFEVLQAVKQDERLRDMPVFILSTSNREEDIQQAMELGAMRFITKPADFPAYKAMAAELDDEDLLDQMPDPA